MSITDLSVAFTLGLVGSIHCVQMCGPLVLAYSLPLSSAARSRQVVAHASYNLGRIATYTLLGAIAGAAGGAVGVLGRTSGIFNVTALVAGALILLVGISMTGVFRLPAPTRGLLAVGPRISRLSARFLRSAAPGAKVTMGLLLGFMPCGLLYAALFKAVEGGTAARGALSMLAFGLGTAAALVATGLFSGTVAGWLGRWTARLPAAAVLMTGAFLLWRGWKAVGPAMGHMHGH
jgi:uncharacterized protein